VVDDRRIVISSNHYDHHRLPELSAHAYLVNPLLKFRQWVAEPLLARMRDNYVLDVTLKQDEAYRRGFSHGMAQGQIEGQNIMLDELNRIVGERHPVVPEVLPADLERAKKGILH